MAFKLSSSIVFSLVLQFRWPGFACRMTGWLGPARMVWALHFLLGLVMLGGFVVCCGGLVGGNSRSTQFKVTSC